MSIRAEILDRIIAASGEDGTLPEILDVTQAEFDALEDELHMIERWQDKDEDRNHLLLHYPLWIKRKYAVKILPPV